MCFGSLGLGLPFWLGITPCEDPFIIRLWWARTALGINGLLGGLSLDQVSERLDLAPN